MYSTGENGRTLNATDHRSIVDENENRTLVGKFPVSKPLSWSWNDALYYKHVPYNSINMFLPGNEAAKQKEEEERKAAFKKIEAWSLEIISAELRNDASVSVQEVQCGDPECAPIDTAVTIVFNRYVLM